MQIFVQTWSEGTVALQVDPSWTIGAIKALTAAHAPSSSCHSLRYSGKTLLDHASLAACQVPDLGTLDSLGPGLRGGGGDGGSTCAESRDCYLQMYADKKPDKVDPNEARLALWSHCRLSGELLQPPCAVDWLGNLYNKDAVLQALVGKKIPSNLKHISTLKDIITVHLTETPGVSTKLNSAVNRFQCPVTGLEFNGKNKFFALKNCGHVLSVKALKMVKSQSCLVCHQPFIEEDLVTINGTEEEVAVLKARMEEAKAKAKADKLAKKEKKKEGQVAQIPHEETSKPDMQSANNGKRRASPTSVYVPVGPMVTPTAVAATANGTDARPKGSDRAVPAKKYKAAEHAPEGASKSVYASIFTSSSRGFNETYMARNLPLGRN